MTRIIKKYTNKFTVINNNVIQDERLSWKARGIFAYLWSKPDDWDFYETEVAKHAPDGRNSLRTGLKELEKLGYLKRTRLRVDGHLSGSAWLLTDNPKLNVKNQTPMSENHTQGFLMSENHTYGEATLLNNYHTKDSLNQVRTNKKANAQSADADLYTSFDEIWKLYPKKADKKGAFKHYKAWRKESVNHTDEYLLERLSEYKKHLAANPWKSPMNGSTWFNGRFDDDYSENSANGQSYPQQQPEHHSDSYYQNKVDGRWTQAQIDQTVKSLPADRQDYYSKVIDGQHTQYQLDVMDGKPWRVTDEFKRKG